jgi:3-hydroxyisobutyrate dehydrogenase-like beta-hydroxyacid dehydrogenase
MRVAVLGLGEAGSELAADTGRYGDEVRGYDPAAVPTPDGVERYDRPEDAVAGCELVLAVTPGSQALSVLSSVIEHLADGALYADLSTASPSAKQELAGIAARREVPFADVALMSAIPGRGLAAPALASGVGAPRYADLVNARGGKVEVVGELAGEAAARKLLRSVLMKGLAAVLIESMEAAEAHGEGDWFREHLDDQLTSIDVALIDRLLYNTAQHAKRRLDEMMAAEEMLTELGVPTDVTGATLNRLRRIVDQTHT